MAAALEWVRPLPYQRPNSTLPGLIHERATFIEEIQMQKRREGFTLIELLIVIVIIGILAAIAIPKFGKTREKAYFKAMMSDLRNLNSAQEIYYSNPASNYSYSSTLPGDFTSSQGVTVYMAGAANTGWAATAAHQALAGNQTCAIFFGSAAAVAPAVTAGVVACTNE
jgi:prepilin-type N-terminal cleavage/methylation domain-containing protein